ncbi:MAG: glycosyltransferase [Caldilineaceae bacterium]|nr:glycosyltransferase [Caldilineaceae bacterium]
MLNLLNKAKRRLGFYPHPIISQAQGLLNPYEASRTFVVICGSEFDQTLPNASTTARMGICRGFEQIGIPYLLLSVFELEKRLPELSNPICWISGWDYTFLNRANLAALKRYKHIVWVSTWFNDEGKFYQRNNLPNNSWPKELNHKILSSEPAFVFTISPQCSFEYYDLWARAGVHLISLPLACDTAIYRSDTTTWPEFSSVEMAFVGGYWPYKAQQFDRYLKPYQDRLTVFGYSAWPYAGYGGRLPEAKEPSLYRQAHLSPTINEPHVERMGIDLNERVFKVLGSGGMTITDAIIAYREWFDEDELLVPAGLDEYHAMVQQVLHDEDFNYQYRQRGQQAVLTKHTYTERARAILAHLDNRVVPN